MVANGQTIDWDISVFLNFKAKITISCNNEKNVIFFLSHSSLSLTHIKTHTLSLFACLQEGGVGRQFACRWRHREFLPCLLFSLISLFFIQTPLFYLSIYISFYLSVFSSIYLSCQTFQPSSFFSLFALYLV